jgi:pyruvate/2-oxoglutarate dehydrogenase complex dihydrolipoamide acyltransferase (E2) component
MDVLMPQLGETVLEGTVATWYKKAGDAVEKGEPLLDVETDKAATEIEAPAAGVLSSVNVPEGDTVDVGTVLAVIAVEGEEAEEATAPVAEVEASAEPKPAAAGLPPKSGGGKVSPAVRRLLKQHNLNIDDIRQVAARFHRRSGVCSSSIISISTTSRVQAAMGE